MPNFSSAAQVELKTLFDLRESIGDGEPVTQPLQLTACSCTELDATCTLGNLQVYNFGENTELSSGE